MEKEQKKRGKTEEKGESLERLPCKDARDKLNIIVDIFLPSFSHELHEKVHGRCSFAVNIFKKI